MICVLAKIFSNHAKIDITYRSLAASFGANHMTYARAVPKIKTRLTELENSAVDRLNPYFLATGLVSSESEVEAA